MDSDWNFGSNGAQPDAPLTTATQPSSSTLAAAAELSTAAVAAAAHSTAGAGSSPRLHESGHWLRANE